MIFNDVRYHSILYLGIFSAILQPATFGRARRSISTNRRQVIEGWAYPIEGRPRGDYDEGEFLSICGDCSDRSSAGARAAIRHRYPQRDDL